MLMLRRAITELKRRRGRRRIPPSVVQDGTRAGVAIAAIVKGESRYLEEWVAFHRLVGVDHFYIYDNGGDGAFAERSHPPRDLVTIIPWRSSFADISPQVAASCHALTNFGARHRWMAFIDVDEFLFPLHSGSLLETLMEFGDLPGVAVPWSMFGTSGHVSPPNDLVIASYTWRSRFPPGKGSQLLQYKSVVDPAQVEAVGDGHWFYMIDGGGPPTPKGGCGFTGSTIASPSSPAASCCGSIITSRARPRSSKARSPKAICAARASLKGAGSRR
jgi:hypothetical protein